jgi:hypothetical protein
MSCSGGKNGNAAQRNNYHGARRHGSGSGSGHSQPNSPHAVVSSVAPAAGFKLKIKPLAPPAPEAAPAPAPEADSLPPPAKKPRGRPQRPQRPPTYLSDFDTRNLDKVLHGWAVRDMGLGVHDLLGPAVHGAAGGHGMKTGDYLASTVVVPPAVDGRW